MTEEQALAYVLGVAPAVSLPMDAARAQSVAGHLMRTAAMARMLENVPMAAHDELAEIYCPKAFPTVDAG
jgi:hypothetical protein